jgi:hypothetical protein
MFALFQVSLLSRAMAGNDWCLKTTIAYLQQSHQCDHVSNWFQSDDFCVAGNVVGKKCFNVSLSEQLDSARFTFNESCDS